MSGEKPLSGQPNITDLTVSNGTSIHLDDCTHLFCGTANPDFVGVKHLLNIVADGERVRLDGERGTATRVSIETTTDAPSNEVSP